MISAIRAFGIGLGNYLVIPLSIRYFSSNRFNTHKLDAWSGKN